MQHFAFVHGRIGDGRDVPTRLHRVDILNDVFGDHSTIDRTLQHFKAEGRGILVYLRDGTAGVPAASLPGQTPDSDAARTSTWREVGVGAQILRDLGVSSIKLLASSERVYVGLSGFGIEITATAPLDPSG